MVVWECYVDRGYFERLVGGGVYHNQLAKEVVEMQCSILKNRWWVVTFKKHSYQQLPTYKVAHNYSQGVLCSQNLDTVWTFFRSEVGLFT